MKVSGPIAAMTGFLFIELVGAILKPVSTTVVVTATLAFAGFAGLLLFDIYLRRKEQA